MFEECNYHIADALAIHMRQFHEVFSALRPLPSEATSRGCAKGKKNAKRESLRFYLFRLFSLWSETEGNGLCDRSM